MHRMSTILRATAIVAAGAIVVATFAGCGGDDDDAPASEAPAGTETFEVPTRQHVDGDVEYAQRPPVGGDHDPAWQNCGVYGEQIRDENAVHSLEHGAVWVMYAPDLGGAEVAALEAVADGQTHVLVSPYENLDSPIVLSAWGRQLRVDDPDDPRIDAFVRSFQEGPQTPELGAPCSGALGTPQ